MRLKPAPSISRGAAALVGLAALALLADLYLLRSLYSARGSLASTGAAQKEVLALKNEHLALMEKISSVESKKGLTRVAGVVQAVDEVVGPLGLKGRVKSVKPLQPEAGAGGAAEESAEVALKGLTMNEVVNVLYHVENAPMPLVVRRAGIKPSFEDPAALDVTLTIALIKA